MGHLPQTNFARLLEDNDWIVTRAQSSVNRLTLSRISGYSQTMPETYTIRSARAGDEATIKALIRGERLDPLNVHWQNFLVAEEAGRIIGIGQVKPYRSGRELGSLVVVPDRRQSGVAGAIINALDRARERAAAVVLPGFPRAVLRQVWVSPRWAWRDVPGEFKLKYALGTVFTRLMGQRVDCDEAAPPGCAVACMKQIYYGRTPCVAFRVVIGPSAG